MLGAVAIANGADPTTVALIASVIPKASQSGEDTYYELGIPQGYVFCAARINVTSVVPETGDRASVIDAGNRINGRTFDVHTWTPVRQLGEGRSWVDADVTVISIRSEYFDEYYESNPDNAFSDKGICENPTADDGYILQCRGACSRTEVGRADQVWK